MINLKVISVSQYNPNKLSKGYYRNSEERIASGFRLQKDLFTLFGNATFGVKPEVQRKEIWTDFQSGLNRSKDYQLDSFNSNNYFDYFRILIEAERKYSEVTLLCSQFDIDSGITDLIIRAIEWLKTQI